MKILIILLKTVTMDDPDSLVDISEVTPPQSMQRAAAMWILKTQEINKLPRSTTENIMQDVNTLYEAALANIHADVLLTLRDAKVGEDTSSRLSSIFSREFFLSPSNSLNLHTTEC